MLSLPEGDEQSSNFTFGRNLLDPPVFFGTRSWALDRIDQREGVDGFYNPLSVGSPDVDVYVVDTGINKVPGEFERLPGKNSRVLGNLNFVSGEPGKDWDCHGHGTMMASIIGGNKFGVSRGVNLWSVRVIGCNGQGSLSDALNGMDWILANMAKRPTKKAVVNLSILSDPSPALDEKVQELIDNGAIAVADGGNFPKNACLWSPGRVGKVITVGVSTQEDRAWSQSASGTCLKFYAPGIDVPGVKGDGTVRAGSGSSHSAAITSGVVAQILQRRSKVRTSTNGVVSRLLKASPQLIEHTEGTTCQKLGFPKNLVRAVFKALPAPVDRPFWLAGDPSFNVWNLTTGRFFTRFETNSLSTLVRPSFVFATEPLPGGPLSNNCKSRTSVGWVTIGADGTVKSSNERLSTPGVKVNTKVLRVYQNKGILTITGDGNSTVVLQWPQQQPIYVSVSQSLIIERD